MTCFHLMVLSSRGQSKLGFITTVSSCVACEQHLRYNVWMLGVASIELSLCSCCLFIVSVSVSCVVLSVSSLFGRLRCQRRCCSDCLLCIKLVHCSWLLGFVLFPHLTVSVRSAEEGRSDKSLVFACLSTFLTLCIDIT